MEHLIAASVVVGTLPAEFASGRSGAILAIPPDEPIAAWTFHVDGCRCASGGIHRTLGEAERCSAGVLARPRSNRRAS